MREDIRLHLLHLVNTFREKNGRTPEEKAHLGLDEVHSAFAKAPTQSTV